MSFSPRLTLKGKRVSLVPLSVRHTIRLFRASRDPAIWKYQSATWGPPTSPDEMRRFIDEALEDRRRRTSVPFTIVMNEDESFAGSTRFLDIRRHDQAVEIGWTWIDSRLWRTPVNTECKYLLLRHAFEEEGCVRVQFKTDGRNRRSQAAILRLGAVREGVLRRQKLLYDGFVRDTVYFSILDNEWPAVKRRLLRLLQRARRLPVLQDNG
ncbi:MAG: GNAT family protein [Thermoplasmata archaeon]